MSKEYYLVLLIMFFTGIFNYKLSKLSIMLIGYFCGLTIASIII